MNNWSKRSPQKKSGDKRSLPISAYAGRNFRRKKHRDRRRSKAKEVDVKLPASAFSERSYVKDIAVMAGLIAAMIFPGLIQGNAATPLPVVNGPLPVTADSYPFGAADHTLIPTDLKKIGYMEEEFLVSGKANVYEWPEQGPAIVRTANAPYTTRVLVRRPAGKSKFSGHIIVEMLNPSNMFDLNIGWAISHDQLTRSGDVWVGITAKPVSVVALKNFNPKRYADLSFSNPLPLDDPGNCSKVGRDGERTTENGLVWDIFTQVGAWLRSREPSNPLNYGVGKNGKHPVQYLFGWGYSQTGMFLYTYINAIHPLVLQSDGKPPYDGYLIGVANGPGQLNQCSAQIPQGNPRQQIKNAGVPVIRVMSQSDYLSGIAARRPDSDVAPDLFRNYEIAGSAHATPDELNFAASPEDIIRAGRTVPAMRCNEGPRSRFPNSIAFNAILQNLKLWAIKHIPPPRAEPIKVEHGKPVLDEFGNVLGGVRSPYVDVPTSTWFGSSTGESFCFIAGHEAPFGRAQLKKLYPNHKAYVNAVAKNLSSLVSERFVTKADAKKLLEEAKRAPIP
jgi:hypothetical protein